MRNPDTTRALKLALTHDPRCQVHLARAKAFSAAERIVLAGSNASPQVCHSLRSLMQDSARAAVRHARLRLPYYLQCIVREEVAA